MLVYLLVLLCLFFFFWGGTDCNSSTTAGTSQVRSVVPAAFRGHTAEKSALNYARGSDSKDFQFLLRSFSSSLPGEQEKIKKKKKICNF